MTEQANGKTEEQLKTEGETVPKDQDPAMNADHPESVEEGATSKASADTSDSPGEETEKPLSEQDAEKQALKQKVADQSNEIDALKKAQEALKNRSLRVQADFDNFRKRINKEKAEARKYRAQDLTSDLLEILDSFKMGLAVETSSEDGAALKKGMEMVLSKFEAAMKKEGVEEIDALGKPFDPNLHQAVMQEESAEHDSGMVIQVLQTGYTLNGRVIRPAMVKVSA